MIQYRTIPSFTYDEITVRRLIACDCGGLTLLICPDQGTTLALSKKDSVALADHCISNDLAFLLVQRGIAQHESSRPVSKLTEQIAPTFFLVDLTKSCNFACAYCFREPTETKKRITPAMLTQICDSLIRYAKTHTERKLSIQAWGGEPLMELSSIVEIRHRFSEANLSPEIVIETNAALITPETANVLFQNNILVGVSIDGVAAVHDLQRPTQTGAPSLALVVKGIQNLRAAGYQNFGTITVVTKNTLEHLHEILDYFACTMQLPNIKFNLMRKNDRNRELAISLDEIDGYVESLLTELRQLYSQGISIVEQNIAQRMANLLFRPNNNICNANGCHGGYKMLSIDATGGVYPCELSDYPDYRIGEASDGDFDNMVGKAISQIHEYFQKRNYSLCQDCPWWYYCRGGCRSAAKYDKGSPLEIDQTECQFNRALYPRLVEILLTDPSYGQYLMNGVG